MTSGNKRWEVWFRREYFEEFTLLLWEIDKVQLRFHQNYLEGKWIICYPSEEFKILATLKFKLTDVTFGTEVPLV